MATVQLTIPDQYVSLVLENLKRASGKNIKLSCDLTNIDGKVYYDWQGEAESNLDFSKRAIVSILRGIVEWGLLVKESNRYEQELQDAQESVTPISIDVPSDILQ